MHLSRLSEDLIIYSTQEFSFVTLSDEFTTGSSIMPQKKNPDMLELIRGKCGVIYSHLMALLSILKGLPLTYNRDLQEDKKPLFESIKDYMSSLAIMGKIIDTMELNKTKMEESARSNFSTATDLADYLTFKGLPFRESHKIVGEIVLYASENKKDLLDLTLNEYKNFSEYVDSDIYDYIDIYKSVNRKASYGGTSKLRVEEQIKEGKIFLKENEG
jgi:argininosuccinate lyase